jgi:predicted ATPase
MEYLKRDGPTVEEKRHAGLQACIDWSVTLWSRDERARFPKLSVFVGGLFAEDVAQVCQVANGSALLDSLRGRSLLVWEESLGKTRYRMPPTVGEYAARMLGDGAEWSRGPAETARSALPGSP